MRYSIRTVTPQTGIPLLFELDEAKVHLRVDGGDAGEDALIEAQIRAAMDAVERHCSQVLTEREMEWVADGFPVLPELISLPREPVTGILSIAYASSADGSEVVLAGGEYRWADTSADTVRPAFAASWPVAAAETGSVRVRFQAGYGEGLAPPALVQAVKLMLTWLYECRGGEGGMPEGVARLCAPYRRVLI